MPSLNWIGKEKIVNHDKEVPFRLLRKNKKYSLGKTPKQSKFATGQGENPIRTNDRKRSTSNGASLILEGDNLEALKALMPFYYGKIKCVYIDPPYNTGNEKWVYNDRVNSPKIKEWLGKVVGSEGEDLTRHDKWLCMMYPRLKLLRELLRDDGVIFISIDDNEHCNLKMMMDEIFGAENFLATFLWNSTKSITNPALVSVSHTFNITYAKNKEIFSKNRLNFKLPAILTGFYNFDDDPRGAWKTDPFEAGGERPNQMYAIKNPNTGKVFYPNKGNCWKNDLNKFKELLADNRIVFGKDGKGRPQRKRFLWEAKERGLTSNTWWDDVGTTTNGTMELKRIFGNKVFNNPKPVALTKKVLQLGADKDSIILDSFAGSGTTAHAVLDLNKKDGGNGRFILVEMEKNIAKNITAERVKRVARGYSYKTGKGKVVKVPGLGGGFEYVELGEPLFDKDGMINKEVKYQDLASYIYFTETHTNLEKNKIKGNYLGNFGDCHYFLLFNGIPKKNILNRKFLKEIKSKAGKKIVYADKCLLDEDILDHIIITKTKVFSFKEKRLI